MPDALTKSARSELMRRVRSEGTTPELLLRAALDDLGLAYDTNAKDLPGRPDIVFRQQKLACFVDGDFWHGGQWRRRKLACLDDQFSDSEKRRYWLAKVHGNMRRDIQNTGSLLRSGWRVLRLWESEVRLRPEASATQIQRALRGVECATRLSAAASGTSADFFAGIGLMRMGLRRAGWRTVWANDYDATKRRLYLHNLGGEQVHLEDRSIHLVGVGCVPKVGLVAACFPCTDLSLAGVGRGLEKGPQSSAYLRFADMLTAMGGRRPPFVILENVLGLIHSNRGGDFEKVLQRLGDAGYKIDVVVVDARHFVPQSRPRLFVIGVREEIDVGPTWRAAEVEAPSMLRPKRLISFMRSHPKLPWAIRPMPPLPVPTKTLPNILEGIPASDSAWWSAERVEKLKAQVSKRHREKVDALLKSNGRVVATAFRRMRNGKSMAELRFDGLAGCLRTPKGGSAKQIVVVVNKKGWRARLLTAKECALLMGADNFRTDAEGVSNDDALFGFGDAVCVPAVEWLVRSYVNPLAAEVIRGRLLRL